MIHGLMVRPYGLDYKKLVKAECKTLEQPDYWTSLYAQKEYYSFGGRIDGNAAQTMMPVYIHKQPNTEIDAEETTLS